MTASIRTSGYYDYNLGICWGSADGPQEGEQPLLSSEAESSFSSVDEHLSKLHQRLLGRLDEWRGRASDFDSKTNFLVRKVSDWASNAGDNRRKFKQVLREADRILNEVERALQMADWNQAHLLLQEVQREVSRAGDTWKNYIAETSRGAEAILVGLRVTLNASLASVGAVGGALLLGAATATAGAFGISVGTHAGFLSLVLSAEEESLSVEVLPIEYMETEAPSSAPPSSASFSEEDPLPTIAHRREGKKLERPRSALSLETMVQPKSTRKQEPNQATGILTMRDKSIASPEDTPRPSDLYPSDKTLEDIIDVSPVQPRAAIQDVAGAYRRYEDGSTLVKNPELGTYPLAKEVEVDARIAVAKDGTVQGAGETETSRKMGLHSVSGSASDFIDLVAHNSGFGMGGNGVRGGIADILIAVDISKSMTAAISLVGKSLSKILQEMRLKGAKEVRIGVVVFRDHPVIRSPLYSEDPTDYDGIEVLEQPGSLTLEKMRTIESKLGRIVLDGGQEPVGMAVRRSVELLELLPETPEYRSRQVVVITDDEGSSRCGDLYYPVEDRYASVSGEAAKKGIVVSRFILPTGLSCGCNNPSECVQG